jgi:tetratricopeptide (TPR) repeat protein
MLRPLLTVRVCPVAFCLLAQPLLPAAEQAWELQGQVLEVGGGPTQPVELRLPDGSKVCVPLAAFSESSRARILSSVKSARTITTEPESGSSLAAIEEAVARCRTAEEVVLALRLSLAGERTGVPEADAAAAIKRWEARASRSEVRLGREWVAPEVAAAAAKDGERLLTEAATMARLGNVKLLQDYLEKASRTDPNGGRADFVLGIATAFGVGQRADSGKAVRLFAEVVAREPGNGAAWNNLAVCESYDRRFDAALEHFTKAVDHLEDPQAVASNVASVVALASGRRSRLTAKQTAGFAALYRRLVPEQPGSGQIAAPQSAWTFLSPFGQPLTTQPNIADLLVPPASTVAERLGRGIVVAPTVVLVSASVPFPGGSLMVRVVDGTGGEFQAELLATSQSLGVALLRCEQLPTEPMPLAATVAAAGNQAMAVRPPGPARVGVGFAANLGTVVALDVLPGGFVHSAPVAGDLIASPIIDAGGRVIGLTALTPEVTLPGPPRAFATPIERVWPFLKDHLPDLEPAEAPDAKKPWEKVASDASRRMVTVVARPAP